MNTQIKNNFEKKATEVYKRVGLLRAFLDRYNCPIPSELTSINFDYDQPHFGIHPCHAPDDAGKDKVLAYVGQTFGVHGWLRTDDIDCKRRVDWKQEIDGVMVIIYGAETMPKFETHVEPNKFPLLLDNGISDDTFAEQD